MNQPDMSPLGKPAAFIDQYDPALLFPLPREPKRLEIGISGSVPFLGADLWTAFELSWLNPRGKPVVALAHITVPCESTHIVESKSFKLYLNSFSGTCFETAEAVRDRIRQDISQAIWQGGPVQASAGVRLLLPDAFASEVVQELDGVNLDRLDVECTHDRPAPELLTAAFGEKPVEETLVSQLLKSNCLVTGQPDWGTVQVSYAGPQIDQAGLLRYIVSFRRHNEFHEQCVERIYMDIMQRCKPARLMVYARYTRRGGLDINPWRSSHPCLPPPNVRTARQ
ncbi:MAG: NADPH-dependent 7-cyano-7-deazaguanine reductase QueF [Burkholderiaceae bacterium]